MKLVIVVKLSKQVNIANRCGIKIGGVNKLVPNLGNKSKYVLHYKIFSCIYHLIVFIHRLILMHGKEKMLLIVLKNTFLK